MFDISVLSGCSLIHDPLLEKPFHKAFNGAWFIFVPCIPTKIIAFKKVAHDLLRTESMVQGIKKAFPKLKLCGSLHRHAYVLMNISFAFKAKQIANNVHEKTH